MLPLLGVVCWPRLSVVTCDALACFGHSSRQPLRVVLWGLLRGGARGKEQQFEKVIMSVAGFVSISLRFA